MDLDSIRRWTTDRMNPVVGKNAKDVFAEGILELLAVAYADGLLTGLSGLEGIAGIVPNDDMTAEWVVEQAKSRLNSAMTAWDDDKYYIKHYIARGLFVDNVST